MVWGFGDLGFGDLGFGIWDLGFGIWWDLGIGIWDLGMWSLNFEALRVKEAAENFPPAALQIRRENHIMVHICIHF